MPWAAAANDTPPGSVLASGRGSLLGTNDRQRPTAAIRPVEQTEESLVAGDVHAGEGRLTRLHPRLPAVISRAA
jgi:hypothetical protein